MAAAVAGDNPVDLASPGLPLVCDSDPLLPASDEVLVAILNYVLHVDSDGVARVHLKTLEALVFAAIPHHADASGVDLNANHEYLAALGRFLTAFRNAHAGHDEPLDEADLADSLAIVARDRGLVFLRTGFKPLPAPQAMAALPPPPSTKKKKKSGGGSGGGFVLNSNSN